MLTSQRPRSIARISSSNGIGGTARGGSTMWGGSTGAFGSPVARTILGVATLAAMAGLGLLVWSRSHPVPAAQVVTSEPVETIDPRTLRGGVAEVAGGSGGLVSDAGGGSAPRGPVVLRMAGDDAASPGPSPSPVGNGGPSGFGAPLTDRPVLEASDDAVARELEPGNAPKSEPSAPARRPSALPLDIPTGSAPSGPAAAKPLAGLPAASSPAGGGSPVVRGAIADAQGLVKQGKLVAAREKLNKLLFDRDISGVDAGSVRAEMAGINQTLLFSPGVTPGDPLTDAYTIASGDTLARITRRQGLPIDWRLLVRINRLSGENAIRVGQTIKLARLPFHAVVSKSDYRMDVWAGPPASTGAPLGPFGQAEGWTYIRSFRVGLGESNGTPEGLFVVRPSSKLVNPRWVNPRTGEVFEANDEKNPIGEHWIGLDGADDATRAFTGYGVHGTIDPQSVGQQRSMGCVRLNAEDVAQVYELLVERLSTVRIVK